MVASLKPHDNVSRMRAGHSSLRASLSRLSLCPRLNANANVMTGCKLKNILSGTVKVYEDQRAKMMDILFENSKQQYQVSYRALKVREKKRFVQGVCYFINKFPKFI
jgi:hypothetical protein